MEKNTGIIRYMSMNGQLVIPRKIRAQLNWDKGTAIQIHLVGESVLLCAASEAEDGTLEELKSLYGKIEPEKQELLLDLARHYAQEE